MSFVPNSMPRDYAGRRAFNTLFGEVTTGYHLDDVSVQFQYNNSTRDIVATVTGSGATSNSNEQAVASVTTALGTSAIVSKDAVRYRPGHEAIAQFTSVYNGSQAGINQYHGLLNAQDGATFGTEDGVFGIWLVFGGSETFIPQSTWNGDKCDGTGPSGFDIDPTMMNIYMVQYGWLGIAPIIWSVYAGYTKGWVVCHYHDVVNQAIVPHLHNPSLPVAMKVVSAAGSAAAADVRSSSWRAGVTSGGESDNSSDRWFSNTVLDAAISGTGVRNNIFTLVNESTFQGKANHIVVELGVVTFDNAGNKTIAIYGTKGATLSGATGPVSVDSTNSVMSVYTGGTLSGGAQGPATVVSAGGDRRTDVRGTGILIYPGETFTFECVTSGAFAGTVSISARWLEKF